MAGVLASSHRKQDKRAANMLRDLYRAVPKNERSWRRVSKSLFERTGIKVNAGILNGVAHGKRAATPQVFRVPGLRVPTFRPAPACLECGEVHLRKSCPQGLRRAPPKPYKKALYLAVEKLVDAKVYHGGVEAVVNCLFLQVAQSVDVGDGLHKYEDKPHE